MTVKIVGCGLSGIVSAVVLKRAGFNVEIFETRNHIGGNCYDSNTLNVTFHNYGPHIFHTNNEEVFGFLSKFTEWTPFELRPKGNTEIGLISLPYSKKTVSEIGRDLPQDEIENIIFKGYSSKQWGIPFEEIPKTITGRIPVTKDCDDPTWFEGQKYQCIPKHGYTRMMEAMLDGIRVSMGVNPNEWRNHESDVTIYTGKIDEYFDFCYGELPYRTLDFVHEANSEKREHFIINENMEHVPHTRSYDHSFFTRNFKGNTIITKETPRNATRSDIPFYPIPFGQGQLDYLKYESLAKQEKNTIFIGRLATYKYLDMWVTVKQALSAIRKIL